MTRRGRIAAAVVLLVLPSLLALLALVLGVAVRELALVQVSIALALLSLPCGVAGVVLVLRRGRASGSG